MWMNSLGKYSKNILYLDTKYVLELCSVFSYRAKSKDCKSCNFNIYIPLCKTRCMHFIWCLCLFFIRLVTCGLVSLTNLFCSLVIHTHSHRFYTIGIVWCLFIFFYVIQLGIWHLFLFEMPFVLVFDKLINMRVHQGGW